MKNKRIEQIQYFDFSSQLHDKTASKVNPVTGQFELTFRCNLNCVHCYAAEEPKKKELSYSQVLGILGKINHAGCLWLSFTGGEPLIREDFIDIYRYAKRKGFIISILTNATLVNPKIADYLAEEPPLAIEISLNGITESTYERISRTKGSFKKFMAGIRLLKDRKLPLRIKTQAMTLNYHELDKIKDFTRGLGLPFVLDGMIYPKLDGSDAACRLRLSPEEIANLNGLMSDSELCPKIEEDEFESCDYLFRCAAGINSFHISPYGELIFCTFYREPRFDLRSGQFREGFSIFKQLRNLKYQTDSQCKDCKIWYVCGQCPAVAKLENGNSEKPIEYLCRLAHKLAESKHG
jgi:radical SAM protein with 4Fe4S-binding SPASM domain